jgi:hypothetical protein
MFYAAPTPWPERYSMGWGFLEDNPQAAFFRQVNNMGYGWGQDARSQFARSLYNRTQDAYASAAASKPLGYAYQDWLQTEYPNLYKQAWDTGSHQQRGLSGNVLSGGRARWVGVGQ